MTKEQWARLQAAVADAAAARGMTGKQMGMHAGCTGSMVSHALHGRYNLPEEKWRMLCEALKLDYDEIVAEYNEKSGGARGAKGTGRAAD